jgi:aminoglycoside N3'-acetyltransferase
VRTQAYYFLRHALSQEQRNMLKRVLVRARQHLAPLYRTRYGTFGPEDLRAKLTSLVPQDAEFIMVHCSFNDLKPMYVGDVRQLLDALVELCGPSRTLVMPAFFFGGPTGDPINYYRGRQLFDVRRTPSEMGLLSELFRRHRKVLRSLHPVASVCALGPMANDLVRGHHLAGTTFGEGTPFGMMASRRTAIVGIGIEYFRCLSQVHAAEDLLGDRFPVRLRTGRLSVTLRDAGGRVLPYQLAFDETSPPRRLERLEQLLDSEELVRKRFHGVPLFVTTAARVTDALIEAALRGETIYDAMPIRDQPLRVGREATE